MCGEDCESRTEVAILRSERAYWKSAFDRSTAVREDRLRALAAEYEIRLAAAAQREKAQQESIAELEAKVRLREQQLFGKKNEQKGKSETEKGREKRSRGQQRGAKGHGRQRCDELATEETEVALPATEQCCASCKLPFGQLSATEDSEQIEIDVRAYRRVFRRHRYARRCECPGQPAIVTAPKPAELIPRGLYGISVWVTILLDKFHFQRPTYRLLQDLQTHGLSLSQGTLTGGLERLLPLFTALKDAIIDHQRLAGHWHADETRWHVFAQVEGKTGHHWYLWMVCSDDTVVFILDRSRSAQVPIAHFDGAEGIVNADRYGAYKCLAKLGRLWVAYCWAHVRRDFLQVARSWPEQEAWAMAWVERIRETYRLNEQRMALWTAERPCLKEQENLEAQLSSMVLTREAELAEPALPVAARKTLESLGRHWSGLLLFVEYPWVPMDNNTAEREQRGPVVGRKNYYGSGAVWSGELAAAAFSVFQTLRRCGINPRPWLQAYLESCAAAGGKVPPNMADFLPWNLSEDRRREWSLARRAKETPHHGEADANALQRTGVPRPRDRGDPAHYRRESDQDQVGALTANL